MPRPGEHAYAVRPTLLGLVALLLVACGGGGGGGRGEQRLAAVLLAAVFTGSSTSDTTPDPGELLTLYFTGDVALLGSKVVDDSVATLSSGTLGTGLAAATSPDARTVEIRLGSGVTFAPGTDTIALAANQNVIQDLGGQPVARTTPLAISVSDGDRPAVNRLTLSDVPDELNGSARTDATLQVARTGFTIDASYADGSSVLTPSKLRLTSSREVAVNGAGRAAGTDLLPFLAGTPGATSFAMSVPPAVVFPDGDQTLTLAAQDQSGNVSAPRTFAFHVRNADDDVRPFENGQIWFIDVGRDLDALTSSPAGLGTVTITVTPGANGTADLFEDLMILGLRSATPIANVIGSKSSNDVAFDLLKDKFAAGIAALYPGVTIQFTYSDPGGFPSNTATTDYLGASHSRISVGGSAGSGVGAGALGIALFDPNNAHQDNNTLPPGTYGGTIVQTRLGVFTTSLIEPSINLIGTKFRTVFDPFIDHRGKPVGEVLTPTSDATRLVNLVNDVAGDTRQQRMKTAIESLARFLAVVTAHECGHSVGLVKDGPPPGGLFGNDAAFPGSTKGHLSLGSTTIFPSGAIEVMSPSVSFEGATHSASAFNKLFLGYLREQVLYNR